METEETKETTALEVLAESGVLMADSPMVVQDGQGQEVAISPKQFIKFYLPSNASDEEQFHCYMQTRATGLNPMIPGECYYFSTGDRPISLFTGYPVYLRKAYSAGLEHLSFEFDRDEDPTMCTVTLTIKDREPFIWPTWFNEVAALNREGKLNARWQKAPNQMFIKCSVVNTLRMSGLVDFSLPYTVDEMGDGTAPGYRTLTQPELAAHDVEPAEPGKVSVGATHQIDLGPLHKNYRGKIAEREIFIDDTQRKMWQSEIIGKASTADWDAADFMDAVSEIESGRCELWVQDNQPKPDPEPTKPGGSLEEIKSKYVGRIMGRFQTEDDIARFNAFVLAEIGQADLDYSAWGVVEYLKGLEFVDKDDKEQAAKKSDGDANLDAMSDVPPKQMFLDEGEKRFTTIKDMADWCKRFMGLVWTEWTDQDFETALPALLELPLLAGETEPEEEQEQTPAKLSDATKEAIKEALKAFGDERYKTIRSMPFKERAGEVTGGEIKSITLFTEQEGIAVLESLLLERQEQLVKIEKAAQFKEDLASGVQRDAQAEDAGEIVDDAPLSQGEPEEQEAEEKTSADADKCSGAEFRELGLLFTELLPDKQYAMGSRQAHDLIRESKAIAFPGRFTRIKNMTAAQRSDLKLFLEDKISHMKADAEARAKDANDPKHAI